MSAGTIGSKQLAERTKGVQVPYQATTASEEPHSPLSARGVTSFITASQKSDRNGATLETRPANFRRAASFFTKSARLSLLLLPLSPTVVKFDPILGCHSQCPKCISTQPWMAFLGVLFIFGAWVRCRQVHIDPHDSFMDRHRSIENRKLLHYSAHKQQMGLPRP